MLRGRGEALVGQGDEQLADEERVPARRGEARLRERAIRIRPQPRADQPVDACRGERRRPQELRGGTCRELVEQLPLGARLVRPRGDDEEHRQVGEAVDDVGEEAQRGRVAPVGVVDAQRQRPLAGQIDGQPEEPVERRTRGLAAWSERLRVEHVEGRSGQLRRPGEGLRAVLRRRARDQGLEELAHQSEGELALELARTRSRHGEAVAVREDPRLLEHRALADPRRPLDERDRPRPAPRARDELAQDGDFGLTLEEHVPPDALHWP
jgi:hypothetical protein